MLERRAFVCAREKRDAQSGPQAHILGRVSHSDVSQLNVNLTVNPHRARTRAHARTVCAQAS